MVSGPSMAKYSFVLFLLKLKIEWTFCLLFYMKCETLCNVLFFWWIGHVWWFCVFFFCIYATPKDRIWTHSDVYDMLVGGFEHVFFHSVGNVIIPIDEVIFFRGVGFNHQPDTVNTSIICHDIPLDTIHISTISMVSETTSMKMTKTAESMHRKFQGDDSLALAPWILSS